MTTRDRSFAVSVTGLLSASLAVGCLVAAAGNADAQIGNGYVGEYPAGYVGPTAAYKLDFGGGRKMGYLIYKLDPELTGGGSQTGIVTSRLQPWTLGGIEVSPFGQGNFGFVMTDNHDSDAYLASNANSPSVLGLRARYDLNEDIRFSGRLSLTAAYNRSDIKTNAVDDAGCDERERDDTFCLYDASVSVRSRTFGKLTFGLAETASAKIGSISLGGTGVATSNDPNLKAGGLEIIDPPGLVVHQVAPDVTGVERGKLVRYDSPTFAGFILSASWGEANHTGAPDDAEDFYDVGLRYAGNLGGLQVAAGVAYQNYDREGDDLSQSNFTLAGSIRHPPTGLFVSGSYNDIDRDAPGDPFPDETDDADAWYVQGGVGQRWTGLGKTTLYAEYGKTEHGANGGWYFVEDSKTTNFGLGVIQGIDRYAKTAYATYNHIEADYDGDSGDADVFMLGIRGKF